MRRLVGATLAAGLLANGCGAPHNETAHFSCEPSVTAIGPRDDSRPVEERVGWFARVVKHCYDRAPEDLRLNGTEGIFGVRITAQNGAEVLFTNKVRPGVGQISDTLKDLTAVQMTAFPQGGPTKPGETRPLIDIDLVELKIGGWSVNWQDKTTNSPQTFTVYPNLVGDFPGGEVKEPGLAASVRTQIIGEFGLLLTNVKTGQPLPPMPAPHI